METWTSWPKSEDIKILCKEDPSDLVVQVLGYRPDKRLAEVFEGTAEKVVSIGDCTGIGNIISATTDAYEAVWNL